MPFDFEILYFIQENIVNPVLSYIMIFASTIGEYGFVWVFTAIALVFFKKTRACGALMLCALIFCLVSGELVAKNLVCRMRPCYQDMTINMLVNRPDSYSFPSGHTASSFTSASTIFYFNKKAGALALALASLIAFSRMYLFVHFPTDVLAGALLGILGAIIVVLVYRKYFDTRRKELSK